MQINWFLVFIGVYATLFIGSSAFADRLNCAGFNGLWVHGSYIGQVQGIGGPLESFMTLTDQKILFKFDNCQLMVESPFKK